MSKPVYAKLTLLIRGDDPGPEKSMAIDDAIDAAFNAAREAAEDECPDGFEVEVVE